MTGDWEQVWGEAELLTADNCQFNQLTSWLLTSS